MNFRSRTNRIVTIVGTIMLLIHIILKALRFLKLHGDIEHCFSISSYILDILLFPLWGISIYWRVVQNHIRRGLFAVVGIETFWIALRTVKYIFFEGNVLLMRYSWYFFYLPMLMLPAMVIKLAIYLGKNESRSRRKITSFFPILSTLMFTLVITNDLHSLVFEIPSGVDGLSAGNYKYGIGMFIVIGYIAVCTFAALVIMYRNCRRLQKKFSGVLPIIPFIVLSITMLLNMAGIPHIDITYNICFCISVSLEACLQTGIIQTNSSYRYIFRNSSIGLALVNDDLEPVIVSDAYIPVSDELKKEALEHPVMLENNIRLSESPIIFGHALWQDDLSELAETVQKIKDTNEFLQDKTDTLQAEYISSKREHQLKEKNRLYNMLFDQSESYIRYYEELTEKLAVEEDRESIREISIKIAYVSAFIKRSINIIFLYEEEKEINSRELILCIDESLKILSLNGVDVSCRSQLETPLTFEKITSLYERFYIITADMINRITEMDVELCEKNGSAAMIIRIKSNNDLSDINSIEKSGNEWKVMIK